MGAPLQVDHRALHSVLGPHHRISFPRQLLGIVGRPQQPRLGREILQNFALVPNVVSRCEHVQPELQQLFGDQRCNSKAAGGILRVGDGEIYVFGGDDVVELIGNNAAAGGGEYIADEEDIHSGGQLWNVERTT